jgi:hypothetical protein
VFPPVETPTAIDAKPLALAVTTPAFNPNDIPLELLNVIALRLLLVVPALTFMFVRLVATEAVIVEAFSPKETPFELLNVTALRLLLVVPALKLTLVRLVETLAVIVLPLSPKLTPLEFEKTMVFRLFEVVPAEILTGAAAAVPPDMTTDPLLIPTDTLPAPWKIRLDALEVPVLDWVVLPVANIVIC